MVLLDIDSDINTKEIDISSILELFPTLNIQQTRDTLSKCNNNIEETINYLIENIDSVTVNKNSKNIRGNDGTGQEEETHQFLTEEEIKNELLLKQLLADELKSQEKENIKKRHNCLICYEDLPITDFYILDECNHKYCTQCLKNHYTYQIKSGYPQLKCPFTNCKYMVTYEEAQHILDPQMFKRYDELLFKCHLDKDKNVRYCPVVDCGKPVIVSKDMHSKDMQCSDPECASSSCFECREESHKPVTCAEFQDIKEEISNYSNAGELGEQQKVFNLFFDPYSVRTPGAPFANINGLTKRHKRRLFLLSRRWNYNPEDIKVKLSLQTFHWISNNTKPCPSCNIIIEKIDGCHSMHCVCGGMFCFGCGKSPNNHGTGNYPCYGYD